MMKVHPVGHFMETPVRDPVIHSDEERGEKKKEVKR